ncbi:mandelate racemase/muconate lactonizing enzyme family protein [Companilactobacillus kimchiensis]|uniref:Mandelate racemase muconate lactonizing protein n=1 Tax=Companilactobacillus kimchiensis TaxID=993692 RepID=A0A0R2LBV5_9LACO|nr:enolase C-terminal domain-like protein [Companilactobacillus kimchiensis]KRN99131.1 Mandelate racemase muconate lactonizing protein [Companilactobacillus kimchiensis]
MSKIVAYQILKLDIPLKRPFITSIRTSKSLKGILCKIKLNDGLIGFGESAENIKLMGESRDEMYRFAKDFFDESLNRDIEDTLLALQSFSNHSGARYGMETAILDAVSKSKRLEISDELGLVVNERNLANDTTVSLLDTAATITETQRVLKKGYQHIKYKVNNGGTEIDRILQLENIIPSNVAIRIDPNQSWTYAETIDAIRAFDESTLNIEFIEQPVKVLMFEEMKQISLKTTIPIVADESVFNLEDAKKVIEHGYGTAINIKLIKCGGPLEAIEIANFAKRKNVDCLFGCTTESNVAMTVAAYLSAGLTNVKYIDLDGLDYIADTPFWGGIEDHHGSITIPEQNSGLGININSKQAEYISEF